MSTTNAPDDASPLPDEGQATPLGEEELDAAAGGATTYTITFVNGGQETPVPVFQKPVTAPGTPLAVAWKVVTSG
ncbi:hypothetical protein [Azospirillum sp. ST 5-10]|uniref:hypothetical protein n=1 Tax=unclassified Azospirillum TaxID=2630922 RepID=UPI003F4A1ED9